MANKLYSDTSIQAIANAIRAKNGSSDTYTVAEMATAIANLPSGGGGVTAIASGSFVGTAEYAKTLTIGKKMPKTNFWLRVKPRANSEFAYSETYKYAVIFAIVFSDMGHYNISSNVTKQAITSDMNFDVNNSGTITNVSVGNYLNQFRHIRNTTVGNGNLNQFSITRADTGFQLFFQLSNASYAYDTGVTYDWEVVYFGSNQSTDIVEVS